MGQFARRGASLQQCTGNKRVGEQTACARQKPVQGRVFHLLRQLMWKGEALLRHVAHQSGTEKSPAFQSECRGFSDGDSLPGAAPPCGGAPEASGSGKPDPLTPVPSAGTVMGRAGCVKNAACRLFHTLRAAWWKTEGAPGTEKTAVPVEQPVLSRQTQALWLAASMASIIAARTPASSMARMPRMVVPPGEQTLSLSSPGCRPLSSSILPAPITVWAASS